MGGRERKDFRDKDKHAILTSRFVNAFKSFCTTHNLYGVHNSKSAVQPVQWFVFTVFATNTGHAAVSQINVAEHGGLSWSLTDLLVR